jgi:hypothetical protein
MLYVLLMIMAALVTAAMTKEFPQTRTRIAVVSLAVAAVAVAIAEISGNFGFFYPGSAAGAYGVMLLLIRVVAAAFDRGNSQLYRPK